MTNYKNTMQNSAALIVVGALFALTLVVMPLSAKAADLDLGWYPESIDSYSLFDGGNSGWYPESIDSYSPIDSGWYPESIDSYYTPSYGGGSGFFSGGWTPSYYSGGGSYGYSAPGYTNVNTNVNTNTCTNGSCNTAINAPTNIVTNYPPTQQVIYQQPPIYQPPVYVPPAPVCYTCGCAGYPACARPIAYQNQPYVTLAAVPYTGLELGPVGTAIYWGFLVLWSLIAAYLIAVKKIQNNIVAWVTGSTKLTTGGSTPSHNVTNSSQNLAVQKSSVLPSAAKPAAAGQTFARQDSAPKFVGIDPFIQSQINRAN